VINDVMARRFFGNDSPIGGALLLGPNKERFTIVGVVESTREVLRDAPAPMVYTPLAQMPKSDGGISWHVTVEMRATGDVTALSSIVRREVRALSRDASFSYVRTMEQQLDAALVRERLLASVSAGFGLLALLLAAVGLYGLMSYRVARRRREIGVRIALGATPTSVSWHVVRETMALSALGIAVGLAAALGATRVMSAFLFGLSPRDPTTLAGVAAVLLVIGLAAAYFPSRRAASVDPMRALRSD
jgi:ABC-type antimicrobial peptide transport system permease subunit